MTPDEMKAFAKRKLQGIKDAHKEGLERINKEHEGNIKHVNEILKKIAETLQEKMENSGVIIERF